jgi:ATP-dependent Clp protease protease subunit
MVRSRNMRSLSVLLAVVVVCITACPVLAQQAPPVPPALDMSAPYQITWVIPVDANSVNQMIQVISGQVRIGRKNFIILLSSQGGEVLSGLAAYNFLHGLGVNITTFNMGQVDSAANLIFCAGNHRYALPDSRFLLHSSFNLVPPGTLLNAEFLDGQFQQVQSMNKLMADVLNSATNNKHTADIEAAIRTQKILTPSEAKQWGLIDEERKNYVTPNAVLATIEPTTNPATDRNNPPPLASIAK